MKKNIGTILLTLSNIIFTLSFISVAFLLTDIYTTALKKTVSSTVWTNPTFWLSFLLIIAVWFGFYQVIFKNSLIWLYFYIFLVLVLVLMSGFVFLPLLVTVYSIIAIFFLLLSLLLIILYTISVGFLFVANRSN